jgi:hypothetical protein
MARRPDSPYTTETYCPYPEGFGTYGETCWMAQNEGQHVLSVGLHFNDLEPGEDDEAAFG